MSERSPRATWSIFRPTRFTPCGPSRTTPHPLLLFCGRRQGRRTDQLHHPLGAIGAAYPAGVQGEQVHGRLAGLERPEDMALFSRAGLTGGEDRVQSSAGTTSPVGVGHDPIPSPPRRRPRPPGSTNRAGAVFVAPRSATRAENTGNPRALRADTSRTPPSMTSPARPRALRSGGEHSPQNPRSGWPRRPPPGRGRAGPWPRPRGSRGCPPGARHGVRRSGHPGRGPCRLTGGPWAGHPIHRWWPRRARPSGPPLQRNQPVEAGGVGLMTDGGAEKMQKGCPAGSA